MGLRCWRADALRTYAGQKWDNVKAVAPSIRVSSGTARGRKLKSPDVYLRPMMGKVKEALFSVTALALKNLSPEPSRAPLKALP